jgi:phytoene synthase
MGCNPFLAAFTEIVKANSIPAEYYRAFMQAMRFDLAPRPFESLEELIDGYIYGSATVVGYFLTHVYGARDTESFDKAMRCAKDLAIALQITNFARDFSDDHYRGRFYVPLQLLRQSGLPTGAQPPCTDNKTLLAARRKMAEYAKAKYSKASANVQYFNPDSQMAIESCIKVYSLLNDKVLQSDTKLGARVSVPAAHKFAVLPASKYWRLPLSYAGLI